MNLTNINYVTEIPDEALIEFISKIKNKFSYLKQADFRIGGSMCWKKHEPNDIDIIIRFPVIDHPAINNETFTILKDIQEPVQQFIDENKLIVGKPVDIMVFVKEWWEARKLYVKEQLPLIYSQVGEYPEYDIIAKKAYNFTIGVPLEKPLNKKLCNIFFSPAFVKYEIYKNKI